jgi:hypothetical protein
MKFSACLQAGLAGLLITSTSTQAETYVFQSTQSQSGFYGPIARNLDASAIYFANGTPITAEDFNFTGQPFQRIESLTSWSLTLTIRDGDTGRNDYDFGNVYYFFDGIHARTWANGFADGAQTTRTQNNPLTTFTDTLPDITRQLATDGKLKVTLVEGPSSGGNNVIELPGSYTATLRFTASLSPVPETSATAMALAGGLTLLAWAALRQRTAPANTWLKCPPQPCRPAAP